MLILIRSRSAGCRTTWPWGNVLKNWRRLWLNVRLWRKKWATCKSISYASKSTLSMMFTTIKWLNRSKLWCHTGMFQAYWQVFSSIRGQPWCSQGSASCVYPETDVMQNVSWKIWRRTVALQWVVKEASRRRYCSTGEIRSFDSTQMFVTIPSCCLRLIDIFWICCDNTLFPFNYLKIIQQNHKQLFIIFCFVVCCLLLILYFFFPFS